MEETENDLPKTLEIVSNFILATSIEDAKIILETNQNLLFKQENEKIIDHWFDMIINSTEGSNLKTILKNRKLLFIKCRNEGIEVGFQPITSQKTIQELITEIQELEQLNRIEDLPRRIEIYDLILKMTDKSSHRDMWIWISSKLADALIDQNPNIQGNNGQERAIKIYEELLDCVKGNVEKFIVLSIKLASVYIIRIQGEATNNINKVINICMELLRIPNINPEMWAMTQGTLGTAYLRKPDGNKDENLRQSIECYNKSLEIFTKDKYPDLFNLTQKNLTEAYDKLLS